MRVDKFINSVNIVKKRSIAQDMCENNVVLINDEVAKSSKNVKIGDKITLKFLDSTKSFLVLNIPTTKSIPKSKMDEFVKVIV